VRMFRFGISIRRAAIVLMAALAFISLAPTSAFANSTVYPTKITSVNIYSGATAATGAQIFVSPAVPGIEGCTYQPGNLLWIDFSSTAQPDGRALWATVLAGIMAGKTMQFSVSGCWNNGQVPIVYAVTILP